MDALVILCLVVNAVQNPFSFGVVSGQTTSQYKLTFFAFPNVAVSGNGPLNFILEG